jgi:hypothetical protein
MCTYKELRQGLTHINFWEIQTVLLQEWSVGPMSSLCRYLRLEKYLLALKDKRNRSK